MTETKFEQLLDELLVNNNRFVRGENISPLNAEFVVPEIQNKIDEENKDKKEIYDSLLQVVQAIDKDGGITEQTYEANKYAINSLARDLTELQRHSSAKQIDENTVMIPNVTIECDGKTAQVYFNE